MSAERLNYKNPETELQLGGRILYLTDDPDFLRLQLNNEDYALNSDVTYANKVSTEEIIPAIHCLSFEWDYLAEHALVGYRNDAVKNGDLRNSGVELLRVGASFGTGSAREQAPRALKAAGIKYIAADSFEKIFEKNCHNLGIITLTDSDLIAEFIHERKIDFKKVLAQYDSISAKVVSTGGLLRFEKDRFEGKVNIPSIETKERQMNIVEKIVLNHLSGNSSKVQAVKAGDVGYINCDIRYGYEIMTPLGVSVLEEEFGSDFKIKNRESIYLYEDHTALLKPHAEKQEITTRAEMASKLLISQRKFSRERNITLFKPDKGICHNHMLEEFTLPGQVIVGTDSHTCSEGVVGALAFGIGATEMSAAWLTNQARIEVPGCWKYEFDGKLNDGVMGKDLMLYLFSDPDIQEGKNKGKAFVYQGEGLNNLAFDDQFVLSNMSVDGGALTGIVEPNEVMINYLISNRGIDQGKLEKLLVKSDENAIFERKQSILLNDIPQMVALPGDPRNAVPLREVEGLSIDTVYVGSCSGGSLNDMKEFALGVKGRKVSIPTIVQCNSPKVYSISEKLGYLDIIRNSGAEIIGFGCGDCCNFGSGLIESNSRIASTTDRNYPGRMGDNEVYLINPRMAGQTAANGFLSSK